MGRFSSFLKKVFPFVANDMGIDLGTANTLVYVRNQGIVLNEPSVVAIDTNTEDVLAVGNEAKRMLGRTPSRIKAIRPLKDGVIADFRFVEKMIRYFIYKVNEKKAMLVKPQVVIGIPAGITDVEKRAVKESAVTAGARSVYLIEEALAAAMGASLPIQEPGGNMIVDVGGGTSEIAVISLGSMAVSTSIRVGGDEFDQAIVAYLKQNFNLNIGEQTAERIKIKIGNAHPSAAANETMAVRGLDTVTGLPKILDVSSDQIREALQDRLTEVLTAIRDCLERTPPELISDILERGVVLTGGGSLLRGFDKLVSQETQVPCFVAENPLECVVQGSGKYLEEVLSHDRRSLRKYLKS